MASLAARTREAVRDRPFLYDALAAGVVNYTAAARRLDVDGETDAVATALRRFAEDLDDDPTDGADARVSMHSGVRPAEGDADPLLVVGDAGFVPDGGSQTAIVARGEVDARLLERVLGRLRTAEVDVEAAGVSAAALVVVVSRRAGADALRAVEAAVEA